METIYKFTIKLIGYTAEKISFMSLYVKKHKKSQIKERNFKNLLKRQKKLNNEII